ncbi:MULTISPECIES: branched-chain amino acid ABC transporter permease [unclassified Streptomyces]|uniref:branched-chain amino acid ABC transporter permease n=1 Tax=unclassified Streptomyces TaxID=2593676 RepID=UPI002252110B|nr:branched-chain amino acid ABC transporter permease [Streptomyces sp. NBC_00338]MCX5144134.1 branched-chain amino acid ABC transporter permease [Streptomyces sp. NBC_00338]WSU63958.1 branched-chain amino acid ABC transporter permease [Streptomyces sp. NBC_01104]
MCAVGPRRIAALAGCLLLLAPPLYLSSFWLQTGLFAMVAVIAAIGLNLLVGTAGQLSLGHAFFLAVGAYGYTWLADDSHRSGTTELSGIGLPPLLAFVAAVGLAGAAGAAFSPLSGRLRGMYLGVATLALVFFGHHAMLNAESYTGGFNGRTVPDMAILGLSLGDADDGLAVLGVPFGGLERLWYFGLVLVALAAVAARNLLRGRPGRALGALRDSEVAASVMGVPAARFRASAFTVSSMYAGAAGALLALATQRVVPDYFSLVLSMDMLAMIVIGGLGSVAGAAVGAVFVSVLPQLLAHYSGALPLVVSAGSTAPGLGSADAARFVYGAALVLTLVFAPGGLVGLSGTRAAGRLRRLPWPRRPASSSSLASSLPLPSAGATTGGDTLKEHTP